MKDGWRKTRKEKRKRITVAYTFRNSEFNNNSSPRIMISFSFMSVSRLIYISNLY